MKRGELVYNYPLYSWDGFKNFIKYSKPVAKKIGGKFGSFAVLLDMLWCNIRYGAMDSRDYQLFEFYKKSGSERNSFFTKRRYFRLLKHFDKDTLVSLMDKDFMYDEFRNFIKRDWILVNEHTELSNAEKFLSRYPSILIKPVSAEQGKGIFTLNSSDSVQFSELFAQRTVSPFIMEELLTNCVEISRINPSSLNTLRVYTIVPYGKEPIVISASLRCGCGKTVVDNWGSGGVGYPVDLNEGIVFTYGRNKMGEPFSFHPGTNVQMIGMKIPFFKEALQFAIDCTKHNPKVLYAGVDVALTPKGPELVELNFPGGHDFLQTLDQVGKNELMQSIIER